MAVLKTCFLLFVLLTLIDLHQCGQSGFRGGGGGRRVTFRPRTTQRPYSTARTTSRPYSSTSRSRDSSTRSTTPRYGYESTAKSPYSNSNNVGWNVPPRPQGPPKTGTYPTNNQGPNNIKIVNKYNYHYPGYYSLPVQQPAYPGYYYSPSSYHYGSHDTGSTALGFFLGYGLAKLTTPTYSHYSFYDGYRPRYDHYTVHHYYHNKDSVPANQEIRSNTIVGCVGDSGSVCPANTTSLCTSNGALMCVVSATSTVPCTENRQVNCITSTISCVNNTAPECKNSNQNTTTISIPCVSNAQVFGDVKSVNNTIIVANSTTDGNSTSSSTQYPITTTPTNGMADGNSNTQYPITTTPVPVPPSSNVRRKREVAQNFCVTVVALPAEKKETEGEKVLKDAKLVLEKFIENTWNLQ